MRRKSEAGQALHFFREVVLGCSTDWVCLIWPHARNKAGYGKICHNGKYLAVHRAVCEHVNGPPPTPKHQAAHACGNGHYGCVNPHHLVWKTPKQNNADRIAHGTMLWGEESPSAKLKNGDIERIRALNGTMIQRDIAKMFGVSTTTIARILKGKRWIKACPPSSPDDVGVRMAPRASWRVSTRNRSGVMGVRWRPDRSKWEAWITVQKKTTRLGHFANFSDAVAARKRAEHELLGNAA
jgi:hypothetical protein